MTICYRYATNRLHLQSAAFVSAVLPFWMPGKEQSIGKIDQLAERRKDKASGGRLFVVGRCRSGIATIHGEVDKSFFCNIYRAMKSFKFFLDTFIIILVLLLHTFVKS